MWRDCGVVRKQLDTSMNKYEVTKIVFARDLKEILDIDTIGEITHIKLQEDITSPDQIGFRSKNETEGERSFRPRDNVVPKVRPRR